MAHKVQLIGHCTIVRRLHRRMVVIARLATTIFFENLTALPLKDAKVTDQTQWVSIRVQG